jgi:DNA-directed RNA polymerase subunit RPC12/RpoP
MEPEPDFLCQNCGHRAQADAFGLVVHCPKCNSRNVVLAEVWERFNSVQNHKQTCPPAVRRACLPPGEASSISGIRDGSREDRR